MKVALLTKEYPPEVYGGAGVHVEYLARELAHLTPVEVHCFGADRSDPGLSPAVAAYRPWDRLGGTAPHLEALRTMSVNLAMAADLAGVEVTHSHTWYANFAGHLAKLLYGTPHVATVHSLEPMRPWKAEQLGGGYELSTFCERTSLEAADRVIAVSGSVRDDVIRCYPGVDPARVSVVHNGIDPDEWHPDDHIDALERHRLAGGGPQRHEPPLGAGAGDEPGDPETVLGDGLTDVGEVGGEVVATHTLGEIVVGRLDAGRESSTPGGGLVRPPQRSVVERLADGLRGQRGNVVPDRDLRVVQVRLGHRDDACDLLGHQLEVLPVGRRGLLHAGVTRHEVGGGEGREDRLSAGL